MDKGLKIALWGLGITSGLATIYFVFIKAKNTSIAIDRSIVGKSVYAAANNVNVYDKSSTNIAHTKNQGDYIGLVNDLFIKNGELWYIINDTGGNSLTVKASDTTVNS